MTMQEEFDTMRITACKAEEDYKLWLRFEDGLEGREPHAHRTLRATPA